ncbi:hypothetical protein AKH21_01820 [Pelagibacteraceae bacterium GOM-A5]|nr:hypothetical protein AKH21_01820 [Pelagibacteraceae bacterium GOM-A5]
MSEFKNDLILINQTLSEKGFVKIDEFFDNSILKKVQSEYKKIFTNGQLSKNKFPGLSVKKKLVSYLNFPLVISSDALSLITNEKVTSIAKNYLNSDVVLSYVVAYRTNSVNKALRYYYNTPGVFSGWHSDNQLHVFGHRMLTVMIYLSDVNNDNGPLELAENTSKLNLKKRVFMEEELKNFKKDKITGKFGTTVFFDMDGIHKANVPSVGYRDVLRFSFSPLHGYKEKIYFIPEKIKQMGKNAENILCFEQNKSAYENFKFSKNKRNLREIIYAFKEKLIFCLCHIELFSKWYLKRRLRILNNNNINYIK